MKGNNKRIKQTSHAEISDYHYVWSGHQALFEFIVCTYTYFRHSKVATALGQNLSLVTHIKCRKNNVTTKVFSVSPLNSYFAFPHTHS